MHNRGNTPKDRIIGRCARGCYVGNALSRTSRTTPRLPVPCLPAGQPDSLSLAAHLLRNCHKASLFVSRLHFLLFLCQKGGKTLCLHRGWATGAGATPKQPRRKTETQSTPRSRGLSEMTSPDGIADSAENRPSLTPRVSSYLSQCEVDRTDRTAGY